jgi:hypothetical protein
MAASIPSPVAEPAVAWAEQAPHELRLGDRPAGNLGRDDQVHPLLLRESGVTTVAVSLRFECGDDPHQGQPDQACISSMFAAASNSPTMRQVMMTSLVTMESPPRT